MKRTITKAAACTILSLLLSCCTVQTYRHFVYNAQEGESVLIPDHHTRRFYRAGGKTYIEGTRTQTIPFTPTYISDIVGLNTPIREQHKPKPGAEQKLVYKEVEEKNTEGTPDWHLKDKQGPWLEKLPERARVLHTHSRLATEDFYQGKTYVGLDIPTRPMQATAAAWYNYPLAAAAFVVVDVPATVAINGVLLVSSTFFLVTTGFECVSDFIHILGKKS